MEFDYKLNEYLRGLTDSHKVNGIFIYIYSLDMKAAKESGGKISRVKDSKGYNRLIHNYYSAIGDGGCIKYKPITNSNSEVDLIPIKDTKYYQPVKKY
ncbi:hypothetical protein [Francisella sp. SYW-9]|uniref:hypothetical protein n=1 Tax=Francisella sp. SYW-9 TaxID=2610888 RepID=UPI00123D1571|nr:hypothetical protein [Francisella sp. SYW-9]